MCASGFPFFFILTLTGATIFHYLSINHILCLFGRHISYHDRNVQSLQIGLDPVRSAKIGI